MSRGIIARAPSSTANLGPGFDVFGLALDAFYDEVTLEKTKKKGITIKTSDGTPTNPTKNTAGIVVKKMSQKFKIKDGIEISIKKQVPAGFGMGSSAASAAAAAVGFNALYKLNLDANSLVRFAGMGEQASAGSIHYDNVAASVLGGFVIVRDDPLDVIQIEAPKNLSLCVAIPALDTPAQKTKVSRSVIPKKVKHTDCTKNLSNATRIVAGMMKGDPALVGDSITDVIVEPARKHMIPGYDTVKKKALRAGALGVTISGAGPSVIAFAKSKDTQKIGLAMKSGFGSAKTDAQIVRCRPSVGATIKSVIR